MAIGCSYTGANGVRRNFSLDGVPESGSEIDRLIRGNANGMSAASNAIRRGRGDGKVKLNEFDVPGYVSDKVVKDGSVVVSQRGIALRGEDSITGSENRIFGVLRGEKGFFTVKEFDPEGRGSLVGSKPANFSDEPVTDSKDRLDGRPWTVPLQGRTVFVNEKEDGDDSSNMILVYQFVKDLYISGEGRVIGVSGERRELVGKFIPGGNDNSMYRVWPIFNEGTKALTGIMFGSVRQIEEKYGKHSEDETESLYVTVTGCPAQDDLIR